VSRTRRDEKVFISKLDAVLGTQLRDPKVILSVLRAHPARRCCKSTHTPTPGQSRVASEIHLVYGVRDVVIDDRSVAEGTLLSGLDDFDMGVTTLVIRCLVVIDLRAVDVRRGMTTSITG
jgi:hypothetical protein